jgi:hypothetical protein
MIGAGDRPSRSNGALAVASATPHPFRLLKPKLIRMIADAARNDARDVDLHIRTRP